MKTQQHFTKWKGDDFVLVYEIEDSGDVETFSAIWLMATEVDGTRLITKTTTGGFKGNTQGEGEVVMSGNTVRVYFDSDETDESSGISSGEYYTELQLSNSEGKVTVAAVGIFDLRDPDEKRGV